MEIVCHRCHRAVPADSSFCPSCGLPQLVYDAAETPGQLQGDSWTAALQDAGVVEWKRALRTASLLAVPAGVVASMLGFLGALLMALTSVFVILLYMRNRQPAWITVGAGARIGLVTGLISAWTALATAGLSLFAMRYWVQQGKNFDDIWAMVTNERLPAQLSAAGWSAQQIAQQQAQMLSPDGKAGWIVGILLFLAAMLLLFAVAGGAIGARLVVRIRRSQL